MPNRKYFLIVSFLIAILVVSAFQYIKNDENSRPRQNSISISVEKVSQNGLIESHKIKVQESQISHPDITDAEGIIREFARSFDTKILRLGLEKNPNNFKLAILGALWLADDLHLSAQCISVIKASDPQNALGDILWRLSQLKNGNAIEALGSPDKWLSFSKVSLVPTSFYSLFPGESEFPAQGHSLNKSIWNKAGFAVRAMCANLVKNFEGTSSDKNNPAPEVIASLHLGKLLCSSPDGSYELTGAGAALQLASLKKCNPDDLYESGSDISISVRMAELLEFQKQMQDDMGSISALFGAAPKDVQAEALRRQRDDGYINGWLWLKDKQMAGAVQ